MVGYVMHIFIMRIVSSLFICRRRVVLSDITQTYTAVHTERERGTIKCAMMHNVVCVSSPTTTSSRLNSHYNHYLI